MSTQDSKPSTTVPAPGASETNRVRRPYQAGTLRRLGSVREVTWGPGSAFEGSSSGMGMGGGMGM